MFDIKYDMFCSTYQYDLIGYEQKNKLLSAGPTGKGRFPRVN